jgi:hypothetical protein
VQDVTAPPRPPDIVAVHDDRMAENAAGSVPLIAGGHFHENSATVRDGTLFLRVATTGGAGPTGGFQANGQQVPLSAEILYFRPAAGDESPELVAWDVIQQDTGSGDLTVARHVVTSEFGELSPSPAATPSASPAAAPVTGGPTAGVPTSPASATAGP